MTSEELTKLMSETTPGPWRNNSHTTPGGREISARGSVISIVGNLHSAMRDPSCVMADATLVALAPDLAAEVLALSARNAQLVEALEFYADENSYEIAYTTRPCGCCTDADKPIEVDAGKTARAALLLIFGEGWNDR